MALQHNTIRPQKGKFTNKKSGPKDSKARILLLLLGGRRAFIACAPSYQDTRLVLLLYAGGGGGSLWSWFGFPHVGKKNKKKTVQSAMIRSLLELKEELRSIDNKRK